MGLLYADAKGGYTNPAESGLKGVRADGQWSTPDMDHKWLDATGKWSVPELKPRIPTAITKPQDLLDASLLAQETPDEVREQVVGLVTPNIRLGDGSKPTFRVVGVLKENATAGGKAGLVLLAESHAQTKTAQRSKASNSGGFASNSEMISYLNTIYNGMESQWKSIVTPVDLPYKTSYEGEDRLLKNQKVFLPTMWNVGFQGAVGQIPQEGERWDYFPEKQWYSQAPNDLNRGSFSEQWWLRSAAFPTNSPNTSFACLFNHNGGAVPDSEAATLKLWVVPAFCV